MNKMYQLSDQEIEANKVALDANIMQGEMQIAQMQQMMGEGEEPSPEGLLTAPQLISMIKTGLLNIDDILVLIATEQLTEDALQQAIALLDVLLQVFVSVGQLPDTAQNQFAAQLGAELSGSPSGMGGYPEEEGVEEEESTEMPTYAKALLFNMLNDRENVYAKFNKSVVDEFSKSVEANSVGFGKVIPIADGVTGFNPMDFGTGILWKDTKKKTQIAPVSAPGTGVVVEHSDGGEGWKRGPKGENIGATSNVPGTFERTMEKIANRFKGFGAGKRQEQKNTINQVNQPGGADRIEG
jgi:hypothetical protein